MKSPTKPTVLITGCSDGSLGCALALAFHHAGWRVFASGRSLSKLSTVTSMGLETITLDVTSGPSITAAVSQLQTLLPPSAGLDCLVNNAGGGYNAPLTDIDLTKARALFDLNVWPLVTVTRAMLPLLMRSTRRGGAIVANNTSLAGTVAGTVAFGGVYNASKGAAISLTETLRMELGLVGVRVVNLATGSVRSNFGDNATLEVLPEGSVWTKVSSEVRVVMEGAELQKGDDPARWAETVVRELGKEKPPHWVWAGKYVGLVRLGNHLPVGLLDGTGKKIMGLDVVEKRIEELGGPAKLLPE